ncbi:MAG: hypothetical protein NTU98_00720 [Bacteroidetes bacterium]|nr:hypothetical protein [Bacteroidota bacterium]
MNQEKSTQELLFQTIKQRLPSNLSFVHDISELLGISYDSAYRRIRGEKELSLEEIRTICLHYKVSLDALMGVESNSVVFNSRAIGQDNFTLEMWLSGILAEMKRLKESKDKEIIYAAKDIPVFHLFQFPEIAAFKFYFWHKALFPIREDEDMQFSLDITENVYSIGYQMLSLYNTVPVCELWNEETFTSITRQIEYCYVSGFFASKADALNLCDVLEKMIRHLQRQAERGFLFLYGQPEDGLPGNYRLYFNEVLLSDNTIYTNVDGNAGTFMTYNIINLLITTNPSFCEQIRNNLQILMTKSTLISGTSAKERNRFFHLMQDKVRILRTRIE